MVRAFLISFIARQALLLKDQISARYPNAWLVWEPGAWSAPPAQGPDSATRLPTANPAVTAPQRGDALCFELALPAKAQSLKLGRAGTNDIVINDATVSREHLILSREPSGAWAVEAMDHAKAAFLGTQPVAAGKKQILDNGQALKVGDVLFTYLDSKAFIERVVAAAGAMR